MTVQNIFDFLNNKFPVDTACGFDNVGTLVGDRNKTITKAIVALDCTLPVIKEAVKNGCELIITHHPIIFNGLKSVLDDTLVFEIIKNGLSVISMHTNLDQGENGVNDALCNAPFIILFLFYFLYLQNFIQFPISSNLFLVKPSTY